jgi:hypothetical protein
MKLNLKLIQARNGGKDSYFFILHEYYVVRKLIYLHTTNSKKLAGYAKMFSSAYNQIKW